MGVESLRVELTERRLSRDDVRNRLIVPRVNSSSVDILKDDGDEDSEADRRLKGCSNDQRFDFESEQLSEDGNESEFMRGEAPGDMIGEAGCTDRCGVVLFSIEVVREIVCIALSSSSSTMFKGSSSPLSVTSTERLGSGKGANLIFLGVPLVWRRCEELAGVGFSSSLLDEPLNVDVGVD